MSADRPDELHPPSANALESQFESRRRHAGWALALRGIVAVIFGLIALRYPSAAAGAFVIIFAVFAFADAILEIFAANAFGRMGYRWGWYVLGAIVSIAAGILALVYPRATFLVLVLLIGARAIVTGVFEMAAAISWRELDSRWLLGLAGAVSVVLGILLFASPSVGGLALLWTVGVYAIVFGIMFVVLGVRVGTSRHFAAHAASH
jgi:uncharacterized membrane protein HdeD (DUF308 family)